MDLDQINKLTDDALTERVAELCGGTWKPCECGFAECPKHARWHWPDGTITNGCPDYATDLNAMAGVEKGLTTKQRIDVLQRLSELVVQVGTQEAWFWGFATARQRAEAFVYVLAPEQEKPT